MLVVIRTVKTVVVACLSAVALLGPSTPAIAQPADNQASNDKLFAMLSGGFTPADCTASKQYPEDPFLARLACGPSTQPGKPRTAVYSLYGNVAELNKAFNTYTGSGTALPCPGSSDASPVAWSGGMVFCATAPYPSTTSHVVVWTRTADLVVVSASGQDLAPLYDWWLSAR